MKPTLCFVFVIAAALPAHGAPRETSYDCGDLLSGPPLRPLHALDALLDQNPRLTRFRVTWSSFGTMGGDRHWLFYERNSHVLRLKSVSDYLAPGSDDSTPKQKRLASSQSWIFSGVSRARLHQLMRFYRDLPNADSNSEAFFTQLPRFGCHMEITQHFEHTYWR